MLSLPLFLFFFSPPPPLSLSLVVLLYIPLHTGDGEVTHESVGMSRRMMVTNRSDQAQVRRI